MCEAEKAYLQWLGKLNAGEIEQEEREQLKRCTPRPLADLPPPPKVPVANLWWGAAFLVPILLLALFG